MNQHGGRGHGGERSEHAYVADALHHPGRIQGAAEKAQVEGGHDQPGDRGGKSFQGGTHREQSPLQAIAEHENAEAQ